MNDEQTCKQAYDDFYHKIKAEVGYDHWCAIWRFISKRQARGEPVAWLCTPDFEGEQFLATTQGAADTLEKDGWSVQPLYDAPQPQQQTSKHVKDRRIDDVVRGLKASVAVGSDGQWVSVRREARDAAINRLQELNSDCAHMYESYVEAAAGPAPHPQQIPEGYKLVPIEPEACEPVRVPSDDWR